MSDSRVHFPLLMGAMMAAALPAYSQQPTSSAAPTNAPAPAAASAAAPAAAATAAAPAQTSTPAAAQTTKSDSAPAKLSEEMLKKARAMGLHAEVRRSVTVYCWEDSNTGSRFSTKKCVNEEQLNNIILQRQTVQDDLRRTITNSGSK